MFIYIYMYLQIDKIRKSGQERPDYKLTRIARAGIEGNYYIHVSLNPLTLTPNI
jgi:hypothetical protein